MEIKKVFEPVKVTVVTPCFNGGEYLQEAFRSLQSQTFKDFEWIIVDDNSSDNSIFLIQDFQSIDHRVKYFKNDHNMGAGFSRNLALDNARGEYVAFLDVDDFWLPDKLERSLLFMNERKAYFSFHSYKKNRNGSIGKEIQVPSKLSYRDLLKTCSITTSTVVLLREAVAGKRMNEGLRRGQDYVYWLDLLSDLDCAHGQNIPLTVYRVGNASLSRNKFKKAFSQWGIYKRYTNLNLFQRCYYFINYSCYGLKKYLSF